MHPGEGAPGDDGGTGGDGVGGLGGDEWATRAVVLVAVAVTVAFVLGGIPGLLAGSGTDVARLNNSEYATSDLSVRQIPAEGDVEADVSSGGTVVIDRSHANRFSRADIAPLYETLTRAGYEVRFHDRGALEPVLSDADAFVVIDPGSPYTAEDTDALEAFTEDGGRLLILGEPNRVQVTSGIGGASVSQRESELSTLGAGFDIAFSTGYVYHQSANDGNYKQPLTSPVGDAEGAGEDVALYTAASVRSLGDGQTVLRLRSSGRLSNTDRVARYPVAVRDGNVLAVGDSTFVGADRYNVADNEEFIAYVVEFLAGGGPPGGEISEGTSDAAAAETPTDTPTETPPPTPTSTPTERPTGTPDDGT